MNMPKKESGDQKELALIKQQTTKALMAANGIKIANQQEY